LALEDIARRSSMHRDDVLRLGAAKSLSGQFEQCRDSFSLNCYSWVFNIFSEGHPLPDFTMLKPCMALINHFFSTTRKRKCYLMPPGHCSSSYALTNKSR